MKSFKTLFLCAALSGALLAAAAPKTQTGTGRDLIDTAMTVHQFDTFLMLVRDADLAFDLKGSGPFTIFAPTDEAFKNMPDGLLERIHGNKSRLVQFVQQHVVRGTWTAEQAIRSHRLSTLDGTTMFTRTVNGHGMIGGAGFSIVNVHTSNGMLHGIDSALVLK